MTQTQEDRAAQAQLPFQGLHVYQKAQEAWTAALELAGADPLWEVLEDAIRDATLGIARATARSRSNGGFTADLEKARGNLHAAAAIADQMVTRGVQIGGVSGYADLRVLLSDGSRMLGALIRSLGAGRDAEDAGDGDDD